MPPVELKWGFDAYLADWDRAEFLSKARNVKAEVSAGVRPGAMTWQAGKPAEETRRTTRQQRKSPSPILLSDKR